jgi:uncharacterized protein YcaQ
LPTLHKDNLVARIDLKSDRQNNTLLVQSAWHELHLTPKEVEASSKAITKHLVEVRKWQGFATVQAKPKGNLKLELPANSA